MKNSGLLFSVLLLVQLGFTAPSWGQTNAVLPRLDYSHGAITWQTEPGYLYRPERSANLQTWRLLPDIFYGLGQPQQLMLHKDYQPELPYGSPGSGPGLPVPEQRALKIVHFPAIGSAATSGPLVECMVSLKAPCARQD